MDGVLIIDKPKGVTSHDVVYMVRRKLGIKKVGHTGTLDPIATGVLPILIGKATKLSDKLSSTTKEYIAEFKFGIQTDSLDITGNITYESKIIPSKDDVINTLDNFRGKILQEPPIYSAIKINGRKLYEYARAGETVEIPKRECNILSLELLEAAENKFSLYIHCSSGTYVRSLIRDIGLALNSFATMTELRRISTGKFKIENSITKEDLENFDLNSIQDKLIPMDKALSFEKIELKDEMYSKIINGMICKVENIYDKNSEYNVYCKNNYIGIGKYMYHNNIWGIKIIKKLIGN